MGRRDASDCASMCECVVHCAVSVKEEQKSPPFIIESNLCENNENVVRIQVLAAADAKKSSQSLFIASASQNTPFSPFQLAMFIFISVEIYKTKKPAPVQRAGKLTRRSQYKAEVKKNR